MGTNSIREASFTVPGFFISHIGQEQAVAHLLKGYLPRAFGTDIPIFVSSDRSSIGGGKKWFTHIIEHLRGKSVVLCLVSQESRSREWIHFEAGCGEGSGALIIPVAIKDLSLGAIGYPLSGYQARSIDDLQAIIDDIRDATNLPCKDIDHKLYLADLLKAEEEVIYRNVVMRPYKRIEKTSSFMYVYFEVQNLGNVDVELLFAETTFCREVFASNWSPHDFINQLDVSKRSDSDGGEWWTCRYWTHAAGNIRRLVPVLTRSMGAVDLDPLRHVVNRLQAPSDSDKFRISYQLHVRGYTTMRETVHLNDIEQRP